MNRKPKPKQKLLESPPMLNQMLKINSISQKEVNREKLIEIFTAARMTDTSNFVIHAMNKGIIPDLCTSTIDIYKTS